MVIKIPISRIMIKNSEINPEFDNIQKFNDNEEPCQVNSA